MTTRSGRLLALVGLLLLCAWAQATPIARYARFTGNYNYVATGGSLRTSSSNACTVGSSSSQALSGIPAGASIVAAYLYWGGSGNTADNSVLLNGSTVTASRTFSVTSGGNGFFGGFADVTSRISGNGTLTFAGLTVTTADPYCGAGNVMAGWSVIVIYSGASEPLRAINVFDGLDVFYSSSLSLVPDGFRIPTSGIDGKMTAVTWEGDPGNSGAVGVFSESLTFNGALLDDGIVPSGSSPTVQQFDGTISTFGVGTDTSYGVDVDTYDVTSQLSAGQTSATTVYSAGGDRVFLTAEVISVTSEPVVDLSLTKSHSGNFTVGSQGVFTLQVSNGTGAGVIAVDYPITVTDVLPSGMSFVSGSGTNWSCSASGQTVTCVNGNGSNLQPGASLPALTLTVNVGNGVFPSGNTAQNVTASNTATVSASGTADINNANNSSTDTVTVQGSNLSTSIKSVNDLNGGDANPGDTLRYTITLINSSTANATGVSLADDVPGNVSGYSLVSLPSGASNASTGSGSGANGTGFISLSNITVPANGSVTVVFDIIVATGTSPGAMINNTATISNPAGVSGAPAAPSVIVSQSQIPGSGTKQLYLWSNPDNRLSRTRPSGTHNAVTVAAQGGSMTWTLTPVLQNSVTLQGGNFLVPLLLSESGSGSSRSVTVTLSNSALGSIASTSQTLTLSGTPTLTTFTLNTGGIVAPAGSAFTLTVTNATNVIPNAATRVVNVTPYTGSNYSRVELNSASVIHVTSVQTYSATYSGGVATSSFVRGSTAYVRAVISDPFGSFDISSATLTLRNPSGTDVATAVSMTQVNDSGTAFKTYEYAYAIPANAPAGYWTVRVTANEGVEGVSDLGVGTFSVTIPLPTLAITKISEVLSDPVNSTSNPKRIPGSVLRYAVTVTNTGPGAVDASSLALSDVIPTNTVLCVAAVCGTPVVEFIDGTPVSGLAFNAATDVTYSNTAGGGAPFSYTPVPNAEGFDANVTGIRIAPTGSMAAANSGNPNFTVRFRVRVQ